MKPSAKTRILTPFIAAGLMATAAPARATDPTTQDCLSANENSIVLRREHKLRAARADLLTCAAQSCPVDIRKECARRVDDLNLAMPTIVFEAKDETGADVSAIRVSMDGQPLTDRLEGTAISIDPGSHVFRFEAAGVPAVEKTFVIREGQKERRELIILGSAPPAAVELMPAAQPAGMATSAPSAAPMPASAPPPGHVGDQASPLPLIGIVTGGVGIVALGVGGVLGLSARSKYEESNKNGHCDASGCDSTGLKARDDAFSTAGLSTGFFIAGGILTAGGITLYFIGTSRRGKPSATVRLSPLVAANGGGALVQGGF